MSFTFYVATFLLAMVWLVPVFFLILTALRSQGDIIDRGVFSWPKAIHFHNFTAAWKTARLGQLFLSSLFLTLVKVPLGLLVSSLAAFALAKLRLPWRRGMLMFFLLGLGVPVQVTLLPLVLLSRQLGATDTPWALIGPYVAFGIPLQTLVLTAFFRRIPESLIEAARLDGCSELGVFMRVVLPLSKPVMATLAVIDAVGTWNEFLLALVLLTSQTWRTVPVGLVHFQGQFGVRYAELSAAVLIAVAPVVLVYVLFQRYMVGGLTAGALKE